VNASVAFSFPLNTIINGEHWGFENFFDVVRQACPEPAEGLTANGYM
jgi:hypothetical protein